MTSLTIYCPHCGAKLEVPGEFVLSDFECPVCSGLIEKIHSESIEQISAQAHQNKIKENTSSAVTDDRQSPEEIRQYYLWGRRGIKILRFLSVIMLLCGVFFSWSLWRNYKFQTALLPEKSYLKTVAPELKILEKELCSEFLNIVTLLKGKGQINANGKLDGINLAAEDCRLPGAMPPQIDSLRKVHQAGSILADYDNKLKRIKHAFQKSFGVLPFAGKTVDFQMLMPEENFSGIVVHTTGNYQHFYLQETAKNQLLKSLLPVAEDLADEPLERVRGRWSQSDIRQFSAAVDFAARRLFPSGSFTTVINGNTHQVRNNNDSPAVPLAEKLSLLSDGVKDLSEGWLLDETLLNTGKLLDDIEGKIRSMNLQTDKLQRDLLADLVGLWIVILLTALVMLIAGDFLQAHFDQADLLRSRLKKQ